MNLLKEAVIKMAEKRMFSNAIVDSDAFLTMPATAQNLYFHLGMRADDDGFVNKPLQIVVLSSATITDYNLLLERKFVFHFVTGVCVIKHWKINNYLRSDRYKKSNYDEELQCLETKENNSYKIRDNLGSNVVYHLSTEYNTNLLYTNTNLSLKDLKEPKKEKKIKEDKEDNFSGLYKEVLNLWNSKAEKTKVPSVSQITQKRKSNIKTRLEDFTAEERTTIGDLELLKNVIERAFKSDFLTKGTDDRAWIMNFDWVFGSPTNFIKVYEGNYDNKVKSSKAGTYEENIRGRGTVL